MTQSLASISIEAEPAPLVADAGHRTPESVALRREAEARRLTTLVIGAWPALSHSPDGPS
jgi:hypothetical protein